MIKTNDSQNASATAEKIAHSGPSWEVWMSCLSQACIDRIALKTGFKTADGRFNPDKSAEFNNAVNVAKVKKLGLIARAEGSK